MLQIRIFIVSVFFLFFVIFGIANRVFFLNHIQNFRYRIFLHDFYLCLVLINQCHDVFLVFYLTQTKAYNEIFFFVTSLQPKLHTEFEFVKRTKTLNFKRTKILNFQRTKTLNFQRINTLNFKRTKNLNFKRTNTLNFKRIRNFEFQTNKNFEFQTNKNFEFQTNKNFEFQTNINIEFQTNKNFEFQAN